MERIPADPPPARGAGEATGTSGWLIVNADDWGRDRLTTDRILECSRRGAVSSASAMVFMEDSARAADLAREHGLETGLHLNFTTPFTAAGCPAGLIARQQRLAGHLLRHRLAPAVFHPGLIRSFAHSVAAQIEEYTRLYGVPPAKLDGHHHMHLCSNVLLQNLLPPGTLVRRSFSFRPGERSPANRLYRRLVDRRLARRHRLTGWFFALPPLAPPERLAGIFALARQAVVELETHPVQPEEHRFLAGGEIFRHLGDVPLRGAIPVPAPGQPAGRRL